MPVGWLARQMGPKKASTASSCTKVWTNAGARK
jgi:hypothetical protein